MNRGEQWERANRRKKIAVLGVAALLGGMSPLILAVAGDESVVLPAAAAPDLHFHLPVAARLLVTLVFLGGLGIVARYNWHISDEVRRSHLLSFWAAIGLSVTITFLAYLMLGSFIPEPARLPLAFILPFAAGCLFAIVRWIKDGFVW